LFERVSRSSARRARQGRAETTPSQLGAFALDESRLAAPAGNAKSGGAVIDDAPVAGVRRCRPTPNAATETGGARNQRARGPAMAASAKSGGAVMDHAPVAGTRRCRPTPNAAAETGATRNERGAWADGGGKREES
jgi:hypothetical protein